MKPTGWSRAVLGAMLVALVGCDQQIADPAPPAGADPVAGVLVTPEAASDPATRGVAPTLTPELRVAITAAVRAALTENGLRQDLAEGLLPQFFQHVETSAGGEHHSSDFQ